MNADGSAKTNLTNTSLSWEFAPAWSPNGRQIAYWRPEEVGGVGGIWAMYANGTGQRNITNNTAVSSSQAPDWQAIP
jgi:Tol biopolymer transport system component